MKIVYEHSEIQEAIAEHAAKRGFYVDNSNVDLADVGNGDVCIEAELVGVSTKKPTPGSLVEQPVKKTRAKRTPKVEPTVVTGAVKADEVDSAVDETTLAAYRKAQEAKQQPAIDVPALTETPDNIAVPKATAGVVSEAQTTAVVDRMMAEEPETEEEVVAEVLPTAAELTAKKPAVTGFLRKKLEAQQAAAAQAQSE